MGKEEKTEVQDIMFIISIRIQVNISSCTLTLQVCIFNLTQHKHQKHGLGAQLVNRAS